MDTAMRDLEQIQERDGDEGTARRGAVFLLAGAVTLGLVYAMANVLGADVAEAAPAVDPLAALGASEGLSREAAEAEGEDVPLERVERRELSFPRTLLGDDRPEVAATFAAAAAEHATLVGRALVPTFANVPAAVAATPDHQALVDAVAHDPLVASSLPAAARGERGSVGQDGAYTLQVISYRTSEEAELFAEALRARGHDAFVQEADVENRGRFWRVRVGPFEARGVAERYRQRFETEEQMTTFVVRRRD